ncbi:alpha/beta fold hydrolase [Halopseudomonas salegens]|uniref:3-oxoadipate enol-lactonase n=1 Tax=Halopseudomonas salegens TaxID=1434072 RepID=A0A1H2EY53_9GAMM|nr:alpha/beta hydrolase [Halopseudomonas salegens]SDU00070.1 3-oxoadipate enol-lactonase [Halopseudomonas salegens]
MPDIQLNGHRLHYTDQGQGPAVLLIHGLGSSSLDWEYQLPALTPNYRVLTLDMLGHGQSDKPRSGYSIKAFADDTLAFIQHLGLEQPHIVGISMGGMIAFQVSVDHPDIPASLTIVNSGPEVVPRSFADYRMAGKRLFFAHVLPLKTVSRGLARLLFPEPQQEELRQKFERRWQANDRNAYLASLRAIVGWGVRERLGDIRCPVLVICADQDYTPVEQKRAYVKELANAQLEVIRNSRHATPVDQPDEFNQLLLDFLDRQVASHQPHL